MQAVFTWIHIEDPDLLVSDLACGALVENHREVEMKPEEAKNQAGRKHGRG